MIMHGAGIRYHDAFPGNKPMKLLMPFSLGNDAPEAAVPVAGGGLLGRRAFMQSAVVLGSGAVLPAGADEPLPPWMQKPGNPFSNYGVPSPYEARAIRFITANKSVSGNGASWTPLELLEGTLTPSGLHFERHHNGVPQIHPDQHELLIHGRVRQPLKFRMEDLVRYPLQSRLLFLECGGNSNSGWSKEPRQATAGNLHGLVSCSEWTGVPLSYLLDEAGLQDKAGWIVCEGADALAMNVSLPLAKAMDDALLALYQNGEKIRPENGYPLRLIVPGWEGVLNVKWLRRIEVADQPVMARNETSQYTELQPSGRARQFTFVMAVKSLVTTPSFGQRLAGKGVYEVRGLAWSGHGRIRRVEVSADGGRTWADAHLQEPVLPQCLTRFRIPWHWNGSPAVIKSRAIDDRGHRQPERDELIAARGRADYFHYNGIVSWAVAEDGSISHVFA
jgi:sulfane dehydrogenase subunit SoxC